MKSVPLARYRLARPFNTLRPLAMVLLPGTILTFSHAPTRAAREGCAKDGGPTQRRNPQHSNPTWSTDDPSIAGNPRYSDDGEAYVALTAQSWYQPGTVPPWTYM
jgi:hypothetical protein